MNHTGFLVGILKQLLAEIRPHRLESADIAAFGRRVLTMAGNVGKGWFAILLGKMIDQHTRIPDYILDAVFAAYQPVTPEVFASILAYRLGHIEASGQFGAQAVRDMKANIECYRRGEIDFDAVRAAMLMAFPADEINAILADF
ncbi:MAG: hypothetical protein B7Z23_04520 [Pseudomonadales bacterium 32-61-5]|nr:MAG: hypothetical protein B7Z23_04520 [Pseudomonadales bacterium 32-61-5]